MYMESSSSVFYAFSQFCCFNLAQKQYFIQSLIKPVFTYNFELWCSSATKKRINRMTGQFKEDLTLIWISIYKPR